MKIEIGRDDNHDPIYIEPDEELSFRDFTNWEFHSRPEYDFTGKIIYASVFNNETPDAEIFQSFKGATFVKCHLDNVIVPDENEIIDCSEQRFEVQNDLNDWLIDEKNEPIKPVDFKLFEKRGLEIPKPEDIPDEEVAKRIDLHQVALEAKIAGEAAALEFTEAADGIRR